MSPRIYIGSSVSERGQALQAAFEYVGLYKDLGSSSKVFVKPNFTFPVHKDGVTTTPAFLRDVLILLREMGAEVFVGESNGGYGSFLAEEAFVGHGMYELCRETHVRLVDLSTLETRIYRKDVAGNQTWINLPRFLVEEITATISVPVPKVHVMTTVSLSSKNLWGCCPQSMRLLEHESLDRKLAMVAELTKAKYGIIDATYGLDIHGPLEGEPWFLGKFMVGNNLCALDCICARMMGFDPRRIQHLKAMEKSRQETGTFSEVESNVRWQEVHWNFELKREPIDYLSLLCFHSDALAKVVFDSPMTAPIYKILRREPYRKRASPMQVAK